LREPVEEVGRRERRVDVARQAVEAEEDRRERVVEGPDEPLEEVVLLVDRRHALRDGCGAHEPRHDPAHHRPPATRTWWRKEKTSPFASRSMRWAGSPRRPVMGSAPKILTSSTISVPASACRTA